MAGSFPDPPGLRMAFDRDGSDVVTHNGSAAPTSLVQADRQKINDESMTADVSLPSGQNYLAIIFPNLRDLVALGARFGDAGTYTVETSTDTTNGLDGTWTTLSGASSNTAFDPSGVGHRTTWRALSASAIKAVRFTVSGLGADRKVYGVHLYGSIAAGETPDRLVFTDPLGNPLTAAFFDWGDVPRGSSADKAFKVKNNSTTKTATTVTVSIDALTDPTPSVAAQYYLSLDGVTFSASLSIPSIAPGASVDVTLRRVTPSSAQLSVWDARLIAAPAVFA